MSELAGEMSGLDRPDGLAEGSAWGRDVTVETVAGHPCRVYAHRRRAVAELLLDLERWPDRECLVQGEARLSYREFVQRVLTVSGQLEELGVGEGDRVLLLGYNSIEWLVAFFAAHVCHAIVVLGNAWWSTSEVAHACRVTTPKLTITDQTLLGRVPADLNVLPTNQLAHPGSAHPGSAYLPASADLRRAGASEDDPAIIIFTSGTTGAPKGVVLSNRAVIANLHNLLLRTGRLPSELDDLHEGTVNLMGLPLFHIGGLQSTVSALLSGGRIVFLERGFDPAAVLGLIERERVRFWGAVPTMVRRVLDAPSFEGRDLTSIRSLTITGSMVEPELMERARRAFPNATKRVGSVYGLTEAGGILTAASGRDIAEHPGCVGKPLPVVELLIDAPNADGIGEVIARSPSMMSGYWSDDSPSGLDEHGWLRTGDLGRLDADGFLYITGRSKDIIIRGGENIAAAHVEACLLRHPDVAEVAVLGLPDSDLGEEVAAAVVPRPGAAFDLNALKAFAADNLAAFERPSRWWIRANPLQVNGVGKIAKAQLKTEWISRSPEEEHSGGA